MNDPKIILSLLGLSWDEISSFDVIPDGDDTLIRITMKDKREPCPICHSTKVGIKGYYTRYINNSILKLHKLTIEVHQRRYVCKKCNHSFKQSTNFVEDGAYISNPTKWSIMKDLKERKTFVSIAEDHNVSAATVSNILDKMPFNYIVKLPAALCIDEFHFIKRKKLGAYPSVISDYFKGSIIDVIKSRKTEYLSEYFRKFRIDELAKVKFYISDMNESYRTIKKRFFKNSIHLIDMFHISKLFTGAITLIRTKIMKEEEYKSKEYTFLKKNWKLFLMHQDKLKTYRKEDEETGVVYDLQLKVNRVLRKYSTLNTAYQIYEEFYYKTKHVMSWTEADKFLNYLINKLEKSLIPQLQSIAKTLTNWKLEITNTFCKNVYNIRLSNAVAEANNNNIQTLIDLSYGLLNFDRARKRILLIATNEKGKGK